MNLLEALPLWVGWAYGIIALLCAFTDIRSDKIYNSVTMPALVLGLTLVFFYSRAHISSALGGVVLGFVVFSALFFLRVMGAGDAKLVMALATVLGTRGTANLILDSFFVGGIGAIAILVLKKRVRTFFREIYYFFRSLFYKELEVHWPKLDRQSTAPFGVAICIAYWISFLGGRIA